MTSLLTGHSQTAFFDRRIILHATVASMRKFTTLHCFNIVHTISNNVTILIVNNCYKLEPILIIFAHYMLKLLASKRM